MYRQKLLTEWKEYLSDDAGIKFTQDLDPMNYLMNPSDRLKAVANGLPDDDLCMENTVILKAYQRYPLIIDPSGQALTYLKNEMKAKKMVTTSFLDPKVQKILETGIRFGTAVLIQDVEKLDPILNSLLNKETKKQGGRVLVSLGDVEVDFTPSFELFMATRDSSKAFTPDLCSRVTFVNFTITSSSLQNQTMTLVLKSERPDVD